MPCQSHQCHVELRRRGHRARGESTDSDKSISASAGQVSAFCIYFSFICGFIFLTFSLPRDFCNFLVHVRWNHIKLPIVSNLKFIMDLTRYPKKAKLSSQNTEVSNSSTNLIKIFDCFNVKISLLAAKTLWSTTHRLFQLLYWSRSSTCYSRFISCRIPDAR